MTEALPAGDMHPLNKTLPALVKKPGFKGVSQAIWPHEHDSSRYLYLNAISDRFSTQNFPLSVFLVKMWLVVVWVLALDLSKKVSARS